MLTQKQGFYDIWFANSFNASHEFFINIGLTIEPETTCYDITEVRDGIAVIDCRYNDTAVQDDVFYVVNMSYITQPKA